MLKRPLESNDKTSISSLTCYLRLEAHPEEELQYYEDEEIPRAFVRTATV